MENLPISSWYKWKYYENHIPEKFIPTKTLQYIHTTVVMEWTKVPEKSEKIIDLSGFNSDFEKILDEFLEKCNDIIEKNNKLPIYEKNENNNS